MLHAYDKQSSVDGVVMQYFPDVQDSSGRTYTHLIMLNRQDDEQKRTSINIFSDFLIDKISGAFKRIRYIYLPDDIATVQEWTKLLSDNEQNDNIENMLSDERKKLLYFNVEFGFDTALQKWYPITYELKNNLLYHPYLEGTGKDRTIWMHYQTTGIGHMPADVYKITFPDGLFR
jgi:hypothetical protein